MSQSRNPPRFTRKTNSQKTNSQKLLGVGCWDFEFSVWNTGFRLFRFRSPLLTESLVWFLFLQVLRCFSSLSSLPCPMYSDKDTWTWLQVGFPIRISPDQSFLSSSPKLFAARHVLHRLLSPRHSPHALSSLIKLEKTQSEIVSSLYNPYI